MKNLSGYVNCLLCLPLLAALGCGGGGGGESAPPDYSGVWDVMFNLLSDECQLDAQGEGGFADQYVIRQDGSLAALTSAAGLIDSSGEIRGDGSLQVIEKLSGDIFGNGADCGWDSEVNMAAPAVGKSQALYSLTIVCSDGTSCRSQAAGLAVRADAGP